MARRYGYVESQITLPSDDLKVNGAVMWVVVLLLTMQIDSNGGRPVVLASDGNIEGSAYCGIYAAFGAASAVLQKSGQKPSVDFGELLSKEYVSGYSGSTTQDILGAVERLGCKAHAYQFLSLRSIEAAKTPLILHVSGRGALGSYKHWILFLGIESGRAVIQDGEGGDYLMPLSELLCRWDGKAIAVFGKNETTPRLHSWEVAANSIFLIGMALAVLIVSSFSGHKPLASRLAAFFVFMGIGLVYSYLVNPHVKIEPAIASAVDTHIHPDSLREIDFEDIEQAIDKNGATLVDCRYREDYEDGFIEKAINIPIDISQSRLQAVSKKMDKDSPVILYCQSRGCKFSNVIAVELSKLGFTNLCIYKNGYAEWEAKTTP